VSPALRPARLSLADIVRLGSTGLRSRPMRVFLSALGIAIGMAAMIAVVGISVSSKARSTGSSTGSAPICCGSLPARTATTNRFRSRPRPYR
jgi:hypothetical protein